MRKAGKIFHKRVIGACLTIFACFLAGLGSFLVPLLIFTGAAFMVTEDEN